MVRAAAASKAKEASSAITKVDEPRPPTPDTADTEEHAGGAAPDKGTTKGRAKGKSKVASTTANDVTEPESETEQPQKRVRGKKDKTAEGAVPNTSEGNEEADKEPAGKVKRSRGSAKGKSNESETTKAAPKAAESKLKVKATNPKEKNVTSKDEEAAKRNRRGSDQTEESAVAAPKAAPKAGRKRQADETTTETAPIKPSKKRRGSDQDADLPTKVAEGEEGPAKATKKRVAGGTSAQAPDGTEGKSEAKTRVRKGASNVDAIEPKADAAKGKKTKSETESGPAAAKPKRSARKGSLASVESGASGKVDQPAGRKGSVASMESGVSAEKSEPKKAPGRRSSKSEVVPEGEKKVPARRGSKVEGAAPSTVDKNKGKRRGSVSSASVESGAVDATAPAALKRKRTTPKTDEKSPLEMVEENEPAAKKKRGTKKAASAEDAPEESKKAKAATKAVKESAKKANPKKRAQTDDISPAAPKKAKYNPHVDGKGPDLDDKWEEQLKEVPETEGVLKIASWNVNGIRSALEKPKNPNNTYGGDLQAYLGVEKPDILCINEVKADDGVFDQITEKFPEYKAYVVHSDKKGYAGVAILVRKDKNLDEKVQETIEGIGAEDHDVEGRTLTLVFPGLVVVASYVANAGQGLKRLDYRINEYDKALHAFLHDLHERFKRPVIWCGDLNVAYQEIDIWDSKSNQKSAGHTPEERASFGKFIEDGTWVDIWRKQNPDIRRYTFWPARSPKSRVENLGWRLDYFVITNDLEGDVIGTHIRDKFKGSDHCPILLTIKDSALFDKKASS